jgi:hypothetical protein
MLRHSQHERRERRLEVIDTFRRKGATSPNRAMTLDELGLPPRFERLIQRRLGKLGVFIEVNGKYYLSEERLKQIEERYSARRIAGDSRKKLLNLRLIRITIGILFVALVLVNVLIQSLEMRVISSVLLVISLGLSILQLYYLTRIRTTYPKK